MLSGWASYYENPGTFLEVIYNRQTGYALPVGEQPEGVECYAAAQTKKELDTVVWIKSNRTQWIKCWVVDVAGIADGAYQWMVSNNILYEVDPHTMLRLRGSLGGGVRIQVRKEVVRIKLLGDWRIK